MDIDLPKQLEDLRQEVRGFISLHRPKMKYRPSQRVPGDAREADELRRWAAALYGASYLGRDWPVAYGGNPDRNPLEDLIIAEELVRANVPRGWGFAPQAAHAVSTFGTDAQRAYYLPAIRESRHIWCQLFSEPGAGSDLAGLRTAAVPEGDGFRLNGQKVWTTNAQYADYGLLLARTDPAAAKHDGLSLFALDMKLPGIVVRPLREITGRAEFNEVFFEDVTIPGDALIGEINKGWPQARSVLAAERIGISDRTRRLRQYHERLVALASAEGREEKLIHNDAVRQEIAKLAARCSAAEALNYVRMTQLAESVDDPAAAPVGKIIFSELNYDILEMGLRLQGSNSLYAESQPEAVDEGFWQEEFLAARAFTIGGGTNEIMRNLIAERVLGLPTDASLAKALAAVAK